MWQPHKHLSTFSILNLNSISGGNHSGCPAVGQLLHWFYRASARSYKVTLELAGKTFIHLELLPMVLTWICMQCWLFYAIAYCSPFLIPFCCIHWPYMYDWRCSCQNNLFPVPVINGFVVKYREQERSFKLSLQKFPPKCPNLLLHGGRDVLRCVQAARNVGTKKHNSTTRSKQRRACSCASSLWGDTTVIQFNPQDDIN